MLNRHVLCTVALAALAALPAGASDQAPAAFGEPVESRPGDPPVDAFGLGLNTTVIQVSQWQEVASGVSYSHAIPGYLSITAAGFSPNLYAPLSFDAGVEITQVCARVFDDNAAGEVQLIVASFESASAAAGTPQFFIHETVGTGIAAVPRYTLLCATVDPAIRIRTEADINGNGSTSTAQYWVGATMPTGGNTSVGPVIVTFRRTVSPAPAMATFLDVPTSHVFFRFVEAMAAAGITGGCGGGNYCPDSPVTRGQMSVFIAGAVGLYWPN